MYQRVAIFIDGSNLYHALRANFNRYDLNFGLFIQKLCGSRSLYRAYYYNVLQDPTQRADAHREQQEFLHTLRDTPFLEVRLGRTKLAQGVPVEKGVDVMLVTDMLQFAWKDQYDVAVIVSGDSDFAYALQTIKNMGKYIEVACFESNVSKDLLEVADNKQVLDHNYFKSLWAHKKAYKRRTRKPAVIAKSTNPESRQLS